MAHQIMHRRIAPRIFGLRMSKKRITQQLVAFMWFFPPQNRRDMHAYTCLLQTEFAGKND